MTNRATIFLVIPVVCLIALYFAVSATKTPQRDFTFSRCIELGNHPRECIR